MLRSLVLSTPLLVEGDHFLRDGRPHQVISGAIHYFRVHPDLWADRLARLRALGLNTIETYVAWNVHERRRGEHDFRGWNDLPRFLGLAGAAGLDVILRPGPYICAEWDFGGLPAWLLSDGVLPGGARTLRTSHPAYLAALDAWFDVLLPRVLPLLATRGGPVVAVQVENEYGSFGDDAAYLEHVRAGLVSRGVDVLLVTSDGPTPDMLASGSVAGVLAPVNFGSRVAESLVVLGAAQPVGPRMCMEFWNGWFDHWGESHHVRSVESAAGVLSELLEAGASVNLYMAHGGTNFGLWSGANVGEGRHQPTVTSYDYDAAVGEAGELTGKFHAFREVIGRHHELPSLAGLPELPRLESQSVGLVPGPRLVEVVEVLGEAQSAPVPLTMEQFGQDHGLVHYRGWVRVPEGEHALSVVGLHDRATVLVDGRPLGVLDGNEPDAALMVRGTGVLARLDLFVENQGRVNYGTQMGERKGISGGIRLGRRWIHGWSSRPVRLDDPGFIESENRLDDRAAATSRPGHGDSADGGPGDDGSGDAADADAANGPSFHRADVAVAAPADGFLALPGWGKGFVWLNGFLLGRYWEIGPQRTLYAPAPLWRKGANTVSVLEMEAVGGPLELRDRPDLGLLAED
jgi:beta-galactosidase